MIIDEIIEAVKYNKKIDLDYIKEEAEFFDFDYITKAIKEKDAEQLKKALQFYIIYNSYTNDLIEPINDIKIKF